MFFPSLSTRSWSVFFPWSSRVQPLRSPMPARATAINRLENLYSPVPSCYEFSRFGVPRIDLNIDVNETGTAVRRNRHTADLRVLVTEELTTIELLLFPGTSAPVTLSWCRPCCRTKHQTHGKRKPVRGTAAHWANVRDQDSPARDCAGLLREAVPPRAHGGGGRWGLRRRGEGSGKRRKAAAPSSALAVLARVVLFVSCSCPCSLFFSSGLSVAVVDVAAVVGVVTFIAGISGTY